ncbi:MAG TPA: hypothetical protein VK750_02105 [Cytophagaceae bacterium]|jgi:hypothetical protein|nr:hypothetical protein [Cytophagaceae bacterium]
MKKTLVKISMLCLCAGLIFTACKKKTDETPAADTTQQTNGGDDTRAQNESDAAASDAETAMTTSNSTMRSESTIINNSTIGANIDTSSANASVKTLVITYDGISHIGGRVRTGSISVALTTGSHWKAAGSVITLTFNNYKATRLSDGKSITLNGTKTITNVSGGLITTMIVGDSLVRTVASTNMSFTFDDGTQRTWNISRTRAITKQSSTGYTLYIMGTGSAGGYNNVAAWGTTRLGLPFYSIINQAIVWNTAKCLYAPISGSRTIQGITRALTITYGVDEQGNAVTSATCPYGVRLNWTKADQTAQTAVLVY